MSAWFAELVWQHPWALLLALQPLVMHLALRLKQARILAYASPGLRPWAIRTDGQASRNKSAWLSPLFWLLLALALADPRLPAMPDATRLPPLRQDVSLMVVLNIGSSMSGTDVAPDRLGRARIEILDLLRRLRGERVGLIVFAGAPGIVIPPTSDYAVFQAFLALSDSQLIETRGTRPDEALVLAVQVLKEDKALSKAVLLVSDADENGETGGTLAGAEALRDAGMALFVLGVIDAATPATRLRELAQHGKGKYAAAQDGDGEWRRLYDQGMGALVSRYRPPFSPDNWRLLYPFLLFPALLILIWQNFSLRKPALLVVPLFALSLAAPDSAWAAGQPEQQAWQAFQSRDFGRAQLLYAMVSGVPGRMGEGACAYRRKDYSHASQQFTAALLAARKSSEAADALFNLGNAQFMAGRYAIAVDAFRDVLRYRPNDKGARANLELATAKLPAKALSAVEGIPGHRGRGATGSREEEDAADQPANLEEEAAQAALLTIDTPELAGKLAEGKAQAKKGASAAGKSGDEAAYQAAMKKLELVEDQPSRLLSGLLKFEQERRVNRSKQP
ncbi:MAG: VWA domain-containing protein [Sulfuricellaceae bacterium]|nr:VWA domain-containing protein [Sulfuricellaceae bacterium]